MESLDAARAAEEGGADRIELCRSLAVGGLSPGPRLMRAVRSAVRLSIVVMVRPRAGDFVPRAGELAEMEEELRAARGEGAQAAVLGVLAPDGTVDEHALERLVRAADGLPVVFHRAFDQTPDALAALDVLLAQGVARLLSSGHAPDALRGAEELALLARRARGRLAVLPGGGVRAHNAARVLAKSGAAELHSAVVSGRAPEAAEVRELVAAARAVAPVDGGGPPGDDAQPFPDGP